MIPTWTTPEVARLVAGPVADRREVLTAEAWLRRRFYRPVGTGRLRRWQRSEVVAALVLHELIGDVHTTTDRPPLAFHQRAAAVIATMPQLQQGWVVLDPSAGTIRPAASAEAVVALAHDVALVAQVLCVEDLLEPVRRQHAERLVGAGR